MDLKRVSDCEKSDWIGELFPPAFHLRFQRSGDKNVSSLDPEQMVKTAGERDVMTENTTYAAAAERNASALDPAAVQNVYHRVWAVIRAEKPVDGMDTTLIGIYKKNHADV